MIILSMVTHIVLLGPPGSGKGTQAALLAKEYHISHISTGDIFRRSEDLPKEALDLMQRGDLIPDNLTTDIVKNRLKRENGGYILDGYPRTLTQAEALYSFVPKETKIIYISVSDNEIINRLSQRRTCSHCGAIYHLKNAPPQKSGLCDLCHHELIQREDDKPEAVQMRLKVYYQKTKPVIDYFRAKHLLLEIDASNKNPDEVLALIKSLV